LRDFNVKETDMSDLVPPMMPDDLDALIQAMERVQQLEAEVETLRLTDEEREALRKVLRRVREDYFAGRFADSVEVAAVIDGLLERTK
jgi:hypothetical protein